MEENIFLQKINGKITDSDITDIVIDQYKQKDFSAEIIRQFVKVFKQYENKEYKVPLSELCTYMFRELIKITNTDEFLCNTLSANHFEALSLLSLYTKERDNKEREDNELKIIKIILWTYDSEFLINLANFDQVDALINMKTRHKSLWPSISAIVASYININEYCIDKLKKLKVERDAIQIHDLLEILHCERARPSVETKKAILEYAFSDNWLNKSNGKITIDDLMFQEHFKEYTRDYSMDLSEQLTLASKNNNNKLIGYAFDVISENNFIESFDQIVYLLCDEEMKINNEALEYFDRYVDSIAYSDTSIKMKPALDFLVSEYTIARCSENEKYYSFCKKIIRFFISKFGREAVEYLNAKKETEIIDDKLKGLISQPMNEITNDLDLSMVVEIIGNPVALIGEQKIEKLFEWINKNSEAKLNTVEVYPFIVRMFESLMYFRYNGSDESNIPATIIKFIYQSFANKTMNPGDEYILIAEYLPKQTIEIINGFYGMNSDLFLRCMKLKMPSDSYIDILIEMMKNGKEFKAEDLKNLFSTQKNYSGSCELISIFQKILSCIKTPENEKQYFLLMNAIYSNNRSFVVELEPVIEDITNIMFDPIHFAWNMNEIGILTLILTDYRQLITGNDALCQEFDEKIYEKLNQRFWSKVTNLNINTTDYPLEKKLINMLLHMLQPEDNNYGEIYDDSALKDIKYNSDENTNIINIINQASEIDPDFSERITNDFRILPGENTYCITDFEFSDFSIFINDINNDLEKYLYDFLKQERITTSELVAFHSKDRFIKYPMSLDINKTKYDLIGICGGKALIKVENRWINLDDYKEQCVDSNNKEFNDNCSPKFLFYAKENHSSLDHSSIYNYAGMKELAESCCEKVIEKYESIIE